MPPKILLIHGFAVGLSSPILRCKLGPEAEFLAFKDDIADGLARVFKWGIQARVAWSQLLNPFYIYRHYKLERAMALDEATHEQLQIELEQMQPEVIVCHSMGCVLLQAHLLAFKLPSSVRAIVFVQSDSEFGARVDVSVPVYNLYCPWDPTLIASSLTRGQWCAGLRPMKSRGTHNRLFPLYRLPNLHTSSIRGAQLKQFVRTLNQKHV